MIIFGMNHYTAIRFLLKLLRLMSVGGCGSRSLVMFLPNLGCLYIFFKYEGNVGQEVVFDSRALKWYNGGVLKEVRHANDDER